MHDYYSKRYAAYRVPPAAQYCHIIHSIYTIFGM